jgi:hypothetical protein
MLLKALEFAFGTFICVVIVWQMIAPMLKGQKPFPIFREKHAKEEDDVADV